MFGGGGGASPPEQKPVDTGDLAKQQSEADANQRALKRKRYGRAATRVTDPIVDLTNSRPQADLLGGGEMPTTAAQRGGARYSGS